jgi:hypothetical protein
MTRTATRPSDDRHAATVGAVGRRAALDLQFRNLAKRFIQRVSIADEECEAATISLCLPVQARLRRKPTLRRGMEIDTIRDWRVMPSPFRISFDAGFDEKDRLWIDEVRLASLGMRFADWRSENIEPGIAIAHVHLLTRALQLGGMRLTRDPLCIVSAHARGRWYERSGLWDMTICCSTI